MIGSQVHSKVLRFRTQGTVFRRESSEGVTAVIQEKKMAVREGVRNGGFPSKADKLESTSYILIIVKGKLCCRGTMKSILSSIK